MGKTSTQPGPAPDALADEIKASEQVFIDAATDAFRKRISIEYHRMRGYALEAGANIMSLSVTVTCCFDPTNRFVVVKSLPDFVPLAGETSVDLPALKPHGS